VAESILVIADQVGIATLIGRYLTGIGLRPLIANDVRHAGLLLQRETPAAVVLDLATPGHCDAVMQWLRRDSGRASMLIVQVSALARNGGAPRGEMRADVLVPKPFSPRQIVDGVRSALARRAARQRIAVPPRIPAPPRVVAPPTRPAAPSNSVSI
jgi:DNA-binding response OmpR family regulator